MQACAWIKAFNKSSDSFISQMPHDHINLSSVELLIAHSAHTPLVWLPRTERQKASLQGKDMFIASLVGAFA